MGYCTVTSILAVSPDLPQTTTSAGYTATAAIISAQIDRADALINAKLARRYSVPFATTPPLIISISEDITKYYSYRQLYAQDNQNTARRMEELLRPELDNAFDLLRQIRDGELDLVNTAGSLISENTALVDDQIESTNEDYYSIFDVDDPLDWSIASSRLDNIASGRG